ncbi:MAG: DegT/DnrJ/EryC1/StrS family aminotransferase [Anaerolineaceae bacterium]
MSDHEIPLANPKAAFEEHSKQIQSAINRFLNSGNYILGQEVKAFENAFASFIGLNHCVTVNNGTDAIVIALKALGIGEGDEVITVSHTAVATVAAIELCGATPVLVDVDPKSYCLNPDLLETAVSEKTKAILPVHLYGHPADMPSIMMFAKKHGLFVIEDCAQAHGTSINGPMVGTFGDLSCFSFYPTKNLGAMGDGGAVLTNQSALAEKLLLLRQYGWRKRYVSEIQGLNTRMDEIQAAILNIKLPYLLNDNRRRRIIADFYNQNLRGSSYLLPTIAENAVHAWHLYVIQTDNREDLLTFLRENGVGCNVHYPLAIHQQPAYLNRLKGSEHLPVTEELVTRILSLPVYPQLPLDDVKRVCELLLSWSR